MAESASGYRCWVCLCDESTLDDMIAPCDCVGTNQWMHEACVKHYCVNYLSTHSPQSLRVPCPICRSEYRIVRSERVAARERRHELWAFQPTDAKLLLRHCRFALLLAPLLVSAVLSWRWLVNHAENVYREGDGPPLLIGGAPSNLATGPSGGLLAWLPVCRGTARARSVVLSASSVSHRRSSPSSSRRRCRRARRARRGLSTTLAPTWAPRAPTTWTPLRRAPLPLSACRWPTSRSPHPTR